MSVIVATYNSEPAALTKLVDSIAAQPMAARDVEIVFVDDGSTDDTRDRLAEIARARANVVVRSIENSGWASRPRNVGIEIARGEYLLFMDHDDELVAGGLAAAYEFGHAHAADVVNAKEVRTNGWSWGWDSFAADIPLVGPRERNPLDPMTPHKLYRREFVLRHQLRFPEGKRVLWEDIYFNTTAFARGARIAILSSRAFYHWVEGPANTSATFDRSAEEFWSNLDRLLAFIDRELAGRPGRQPLLTHHVRARVLGMLGPKCLPQPLEYVETGYRHARELVERHMPPALDPGLPAADRARLALVRHGDLGLQRLLAELDDGVFATPTLDAVEWVGSALVLTISATLTTGAGEPLRLRRVGDRWLRVVPQELADVLPAHALDVTDDVERAAFTASVKGRSSRSTWRLTGNGAVRCVVERAGDGALTGTLTGSVVARFDPVAFAAEHGLTDPVWDFAARFEALGFAVHRPLRGGVTRVGLLAGSTAVGYVNKAGLYSLDVSSSVRSVTGSARPPVVSASVAARAAGSGLTAVDVRLPMPDVHCAGDSRLAGTAVLGGGATAPLTLTATGRRAVLEGGDAVLERGDAVLEFSAALRDGEHPVRVELEGRVGDTGLVLVVAAGTARLRAASQAAAQTRK
ncbi:glycosyltransferase [uncultured Jatrophihabitans sp.]|uniref:glycosyltransferase n=1 Tax=uncultured Jatrophihabitans sp. TaxID=1610747 RepID=UPI0035C97132